MGGGGGAGTQVSQCSPSHRWKLAHQVGKLQVIAEAIESSFGFGWRTKITKLWLPKRQGQGAGRPPLLRVNSIHISPPLKTSEVQARDGQRKKKGEKKGKRVRRRVRPPLLLQILSICHITFKQHEKRRERPCNNIVWRLSNSMQELGAHFSKTRTQGRCNSAGLITSDCLQAAKMREHTAEKRTLDYSRMFRKRKNNLTEICDIMATAGKN